MGGGIQAGEATEIRRAISVLKMRDSNHAKGVWEFGVDEHGLAIADAQLEGLTGLLGWTALRDEAPRSR